MIFKYLKGINDLNLLTNLLLYSLSSIAYSELVNNPLRLSGFFFQISWDQIMYVCLFERVRAAR